MAVVVFFLGLIVLFYLWAQVADWWEERAFRQKLQGLQQRFKELDETVLEEGEQALQTLDKLAAAVKEHGPYQQQLRDRKDVYRPATSFQRKFKRR